MRSAAKQKELLQLVETLAPKVKDFAVTSEVDEMIVPQTFADFNGYRKYRSINRTVTITIHLADEVVGS